MRLRSICSLTRSPNVGYSWPMITVRTQSVRSATRAVCGEHGLCRYRRVGDSPLRSCRRSRVWAAALSPRESAAHTGIIDVVTVVSTNPRLQQILQLVAVAAVMVGIVLMHSAPLVSPAADSVGHHRVTTSDQQAHAHESPTAFSGGGLPALDTMSTASAGAGCDDNDCNHHQGLHLCMAVVVVAALLTISRWNLTALGVARELRPRMPWLRHRGGRAPPWTTPTLAQLSVLRV